MFAAILLASTVEAVNIDTSHVVGNSHTDNNSGCNIGTETPTHRYEHNLNSRKNKSLVSSGLGSGGGGGLCAFLRLTVAQIGRLYLGALHSQAG